MIFSSDARYLARWLGNLFGSPSLRNGDPGNTMTAKQQEEQHSEPAKQGRQQLDAVVSKHVLKTLGQPGDLHRVQVRWLWEGRYRVNVLTGADAASAKIANSYFLVTDGDGNILNSTPKITKEY